MTSALFAGSKHAQLYAKFRPIPPDSLIKSIITYIKHQIKPPFKKAIDIGCGSGQSTIVLSPHFEHVTGLDISEAQIEFAKKLNPARNIEYKVSRGEKLPIASSSVELVTLCQAVHWFDTETLFEEVKRALIPNGVIAVYGYWIPLPNLEDEEKTRKMNMLITEYLHEEQLGTYWDKERYIVQDHYASINLPFKDSHRLNLVQKTESSLADYMGYLSTWSSYQKLFKEDSKRASQLLQEVQNKSMAILEEDKLPEEINFSLDTDYFMIMGYK